MNEQLTTAEILDQAADVIERNGWTQVAFSETDPDTIYTTTRDCPVCALGAMNVAAGLEPDAEPDERPVGAYRAFAEHLGLSVDADRGVIGFSTSIGEDWNDAKGRTAEQVVTELRACAANLRAGGAA